MSRIRNLVAKYVERFITLPLRSFIVWRYQRWGRDWGEWESFCVNHERNPCNRRLKFWEARYVALGYAPLGLQDWIAWGGFGIDQTQLLRQKSLPIINNPNSIAPSSSTTPSEQGLPA